MLPVVVPVVAYAVVVVVVQSLPDEASLSEDRFLPVRHQGDLGTCTSFAMASCLEYYMTARNERRHVSRAFLHQIVTHHAGNAHGEHDVLQLGDTGSSITTMVRAVQRYGFAFEDDYPYNLAERVVAAGHGVLPMPPDGILNKARKWRLSGHTDLCPARVWTSSCNDDGTLDRIRRSIVDGRPVLASVDWQKLGECQQEDAYHAVVIVAYRGDRFLIRNSHESNEMLWKTSAVLKEALAGAASIHGVSEETPLQALIQSNAYNHGVGQWNGKAVCIRDCHGTYLKNCGPGEGQHVQTSNEVHPYCIEFCDDGTCAIRSMVHGNYVRCQTKKRPWYMPDDTYNRIDTQTWAGPWEKFKITGCNGKVVFQTWENTFLMARPGSKTVEGQTVVDDWEKFTIEPYSTFEDEWKDQEVYIRVPNTSKYLCVAGSGFGQPLQTSDRPCAFKFEFQDNGKVAIRSVTHDNYVRCMNGEVNTQTYVDRCERFTPQLMGINGERRVAFQVEHGGYRLRANPDGDVVGADSAAPEESFLIERKSTSLSKLALMAGMAGTGWLAYTAWDRFRKKPVPPSNGT